MNYPKIERLRFSGDNPKSIGLQELELDSAEAKQMRSKLISHAVRVTPQLFPSVASAAEAAVAALAIPAPDFYIVNDPAVNAGCMYLGEDIPCAVILNSGLIQLLEQGELRFVIGHELGHHIFRHGAYADNSLRGIIGLSRLSYYQWQRAAEISADRVGLVCAGTEHDAIAAILRLATGLPSNFLRLDAHAFQKQAKDILEQGDSDSSKISHPMLPIRARALHWYSMSETYYAWHKYSSKPSYSAKKTDELISADLANAIPSGNMFLGAKSQMASEMVAGRALLWTMLVFFVSDNILDKAEQNALNQFAGKSEAAKAVAFRKKYGMKKTIAKQQEALLQLSNKAVRLRKEFIAKISVALSTASDDRKAVKKYVKDVGRKVGL